MIRDTALVACSFVLGIIFMFSMRPMDTENSLHQERLRAMEKGVGSYTLDRRTGKIVFEYIDLDEYTRYVLTTIHAGRAVPVNPLRDSQ